jgi:hypothetical protein
MRMQPALPAAAMLTYELSAPTQTHRKPASCEDADCAAWRYGWRTVVDEATDLGQRQAHYIRHDRTRRHTQTRRPDGLTEFAFAAGQSCFSRHTVPLERAPIMTVRGGDWRGNPLGDLRIHSRPQDWVEDFALHQQMLADRLAQG